MKRTICPQCGYVFNLDETNCIRCSVAGARVQGYTPKEETTFQEAYSKPRPKVDIQPKRQMTWREQLEVAGAALLFIIYCLLLIQWMTYECGGVHLYVFNGHLLFGFCALVSVLIVWCGFYKGLKPSKDTFLKLLTSLFVLMHVMPIVFFLNRIGVNKQTVVAGVVEGKKKRRYGKGGGPPYLSIRSNRGVVSYFVEDSTFAQLNVGEPLTLTVRDGRFGFALLDRVEDKGKLVEPIHYD